MLTFFFFLFYYRKIIEKLKLNQKTRDLGGNLNGSPFLDQFDYTFTADDVMDQLGMPRDHVFRKTVEKGHCCCRGYCQAQSFFMEAEIEDRTENTITVAGQTFHSKVLAENLKDQDIIFPFLCTCGMELVDYCDRLTDIMDQYALIA